MKKLMKMLVAMMMALSLAACSGANSTEEQENTVNNFFKYVSECKFDELEEIADSSVLTSLGISTMEAQLDMYDDPDTYGEVFYEETQEYKEYVFENLFQDIKITNIEVDGDKSTATITGKYMNYNEIDLGSVDVEAISEEYLNNNLEELAEIYKNEGQKAYMIAVYDHVAPLYYDQMKDLIKTAPVEDMNGTVEMEKKDGKWIITKVV
ncbi:hypothetical protein H6A03_10155 [[Clostridium] spiroforme]|nr:hypothetical protein [Thomasclavelia spiroformis]MBM6880346.1 hypothetical protein [Thomasclavelia spiroformis]